MAPPTGKGDTALHISAKRQGRECLAFAYKVLSQALPSDHRVLQFAGTMLGSTGRKPRILFVDEEDKCLRLLAA